MSYYKAELTMDDLMMTKKQGLVRENEVD